MPGKYWSEVETEKLEAYILDGKTDAEIGKMMSRPTGSVKSKRLEIQSE